MKKRAVNSLKASILVGDVDEQMNQLLEVINRMGDFYTTSSCCGRITLLQQLGGKGEDVFLGKWHSTVESAQIQKALDGAVGDVCFKYESPILHAVARDVSSAQDLLWKAQNAGFKRSGIQSVKEDRVVLEVLSTERIEFPIMADGRQILSGDGLETLVEESNKKYHRGLDKIDKLMKLLR